METIRIDRREGVVTVALDRPRVKNAIDARMWNELLETFQEIGERDDDRVLVLTGAGDAFCSGADLGEEERTRRHQLRRMRHFNRVGLALHQLPQPAIAKVGGVAAGAGLNLALGCDLIVASDRARFSEIFARRGLSIDLGGSWLLPRLVGLHKAKELALLAEAIDAAEAERIGLVNRTLPHDELMPFVRDYVRRLAETASPASMRVMKRQVWTSLTRELGDAMDEAIREMRASFDRVDFKEGVRSFLDKRSPRFPRLELGG